MNSLVTLSQVSLTHKGNALLQDINITFAEGLPACINGTTGSGKTLLMYIIAGLLEPTNGYVTRETNLNEIQIVPQQARFKTNRSQKTYYQNRYEENNDIITPTLQEHFSALPVHETEALQPLLEQFSISHLISRKLCQLSNGESKRLQIILALAKKPKLLLLDNPFLGLDVASRTILESSLNQLVLQGVTYILFLTSATPQLHGVNQFFLQKGKLVPQLDLHLATPTLAEVYRNIPYVPVIDFKIAIAMKQVTILYNGKPILTNINWTVAQGDKWVLRGPNGSGKSMLLSLINGDNPKAYGQDILLFDQKKGSGESIWSLKKKIGYVSPELHVHFLKSPDHIADILTDGTTYMQLDDMYQSPITCLQVVCSGFNDEVGYCSPVHEVQEKTALSLLQLFHVNHAGTIPFYQLSLGQQRLVLLARALVRNPPLLILDEPCQGLDEEMVAVFKDTVNYLAYNTSVTIIYVSHYAQDIPSGMNKLLELEEGHIVYNGKYEVNA